MNIISWLQTNCASIGVSASKAVTARGGSRRVASEAWLADGPSADGAFQ